MSVGGLFQNVKRELVLKLHVGYRMSTQSIQSVEFVVDSLPLHIQVGKIM